MVFYCNRIVFGCIGQFDFIFNWFRSLFCGQPAIGGEEYHNKEKDGSSVHTVFSAGGNVDCFACSGIFLRFGRGLLSKHAVHKQVSGSFAIEATMVMSVVLITIALLIQHAYTTHDMVTGTMILQEMLENARISEDEALSSEYFEQMGERLGNPRLWLGEYQLEIELSDNQVTGIALAGEWEQEMQIQTFRPGRFLRRCEALKEIGKGLENGIDGIQAGNESKLYGDSSGKGME